SNTAAILTTLNCPCKPPSATAYEASGKIGSNVETLHRQQDPLRAVNPSEETMTTSKSATEHIRRSLAVMAIIGLAWSLTSAAMAAEVTPPASIASAGKIVYCSDISGPPLGYFDENNKPIGSDIDLGTEVAKR